MSKNELTQLDEHRPENEGRMLPYEPREPSCFEEFFIEARRNGHDKKWHKGLRAGLRAINAAPFGWGLEDGCNGEDLSASLAKNPSYHNGYMLGMVLAEKGGNLYRVYWHPRHDVAPADVERCGSHVGNFRALSVDHAQKMAQRSRPMMRSGWFYAVSATEEI